MKSYLVKFHLVCWIGKLISDISIISMTTYGMNWREIVLVQIILIIYIRA